MPLVYVGSRIRGTSTGTGITITGFTLNGGDEGAGGHQAGDLIIVAYSLPGTGRKSPSLASSGYTKIAEVYADGSNRDVTTGIWYKFLEPGEGRVDLQNDATDGGMASLDIWRGVSPTDPFDVPFQFATGAGANARYQPPSAQPVTLGAKATAYIAIGGETFSDVGSSFQNNLNSFSYGRTAGNPKAGHGGGWKDWSGSGLLTFLEVYDPQRESIAGNSWSAWTIVVRPADGVPAAGPAPARRTARWL